MFIDDDDDDDDDDDNDDMKKVTKQYCPTNHAYHGITQRPVDFQRYKYIAMWGSFQACY